MKKLLFTLIISAFASSYSFGQSTIDYKDFGFYHNEALVILNSDHSAWEKMDTNGVIDYLTISLEKKYPKQFSDVNNERAKELFKVYGYQSLSMENLNLFWESNKEELYNSKSMPKRTGEIIDHILAKNLTYEETLLEIQTAKKQPGLSDFELNSLVAMESLLNSSYNYWNADSLTSRKKKSGAWIADIMVGVFFAESGPLSIIAGGLASQFCTETGQ